MIAKMIERDERTLSVENASYRWGYLVLSYGLLLSTMYRGFVREEASWDLLALVAIGGIVTTFYQGTRRILSRRWTVAGVGAFALAAVIAAITVLLW